MRLHFPIPPFSPFLPNLGGLEKVGPEGYEVLCFLFSPINQTAEILSLPSSSCHSKHSVRERENSEKKKCLELDNQVQRQFFFFEFFFSKEVLHYHYLGITDFHPAQKLCRARFDYLINFLFLIYRLHGGKILYIASHDTW